jgi:trans-2-enoyl-CoA reductase
MLKKNWYQRVSGVNEAGTAVTESEKCVLVIGASSGIGEALARQLRQGANKSMHTSPGDMLTDRLVVESTSHP